MSCLHVAGLLFKRLRRHSRECLNGLSARPVRALFLTGWQVSSGSFAGLPQDDITSPVVDLEGGNDAGLPIFLETWNEVDSYCQQCTACIRVVSAMMYTVRMSGLRSLAQPYVLGTYK